MMYIHISWLSFIDTFQEWIRNLSLDEIWLACWSQATMPHSTIGIDWLWIRNYFRDWQIRVMSVDYAYCDATVSSKCTMNLFFIRPEALLTNLKKIGTFLSDERVTYSVLSKNGAEDTIWGICTDSSNHVCWINVLHIYWHTYFFTVLFRLYRKQQDITITLYKIYQSNF